VTVDNEFTKKNEEFEMGSWCSKYQNQTVSFADYWSEMGTRRGYLFIG